jgi:hypothetical protein
MVSMDNHPQSEGEWSTIRLGRWEGVGFCRFFVSLFQGIATLALLMFGLVKSLLWMLPCAF